MTVNNLPEPDNASLLVELLTEELPPRALERLSDAFGEQLFEGLRKHHLLNDDSALTVFATPRRLAAHVTHVPAVAPEQPFEEKLMPVRVGLNEDGEATPALQKRLAARGLSHLQVSDLQQVDDGKQMFLVATGVRAGETLVDTLQDIIVQAIESLPIPKVMRYQLEDGVTSVSFVRPAHGLVALHGRRVIPAHVLGLTAGNTTQGHRFLAPEPVAIPSADDYESTLAQRHVTASFKARRAEIARQLDTQAQTLGASLGEDTAATDALLNEVTALVETVAVHAGSFEPKFLAVPHECLTLTMRLNQKYFPLFDPKTGALTHQFLIVSNMPVEDSAAIVEGNERVIRPRLADAEFFYATDCNQPLEDRIQVLDDMVYHNRLGSEGERVRRLAKTAAWIGDRLGADVALCERAAQLAKADLSTLMVGEFPELQGVIGGYYARHHGEPQAVAHAIACQYQLRWPSAPTPTDLPAVALYMAERAQTLIGIWGIGQAPTGERDPFGLRRAALGLISAYEQLHASGDLPLTGKPVMPLEDLLEATFETFGEDTALSADTVREVAAFVRERYRNQRVQEQDRMVVDAVFALNVPLEQIDARIAATTTFLKEDAAASLSNANKRIGNILRKAPETLPEVDEERFCEDAEKALWQQISEAEPKIATYMDQANYGQALATLALLHEPVDTFFEEVMVMDPDSDVRNNRLAMLSRLHGLMNQVADISRLAT